MSRRKRLIMMSVGAFCIAAFAACSVLPWSGGGKTADRRFEEFTESISQKPEIQTSVDLLVDRMPGLGAVEVHYAAAYRESGRELPDPDPQYWLDAVIKVDEVTAPAFSRLATGEPKLLPGIYPPLREFVPEDCSWTLVDEELVDEELKTAKAADRFDITGVVYSANCRILIIRGTGW